ncbi:PDZ domain-containing protein [Pinibacter soli]|uniref:PDZ domain-containing protein n=1 Tax=Pinibacter soli TaxID=3044211 RepID=A0ABT6RIS8_9BACT|nr:PDZ domain-containing protein [Pinibacter soli]MDI3322326.1 PDZ domain-containing protein [Pinibacter soli]
MKHFAKTIALFAGVLAATTSFTQGVKNGILAITIIEKHNCAKITAVTPGGPAEKAGLKVGDSITKIDDMAVTSPEDLSESLKSFKQNDTVTISYKRNKKDYKVAATLTGPPTNEMK